MGVVLVRLSHLSLERVVQFIVAQVISMDITPDGMARRVTDLVCDCMCVMKVIGSTQR